MNISEHKDEKIEGDKLDLLFNRQREVESKWASIEGFPERLVFGKLENLHSPEICKHIQQNILWRMTEEVHELSVALKNGKNWRKAKYFTDVNEALDELADIYIYAINLCFAMGIDPKMLTQTILKKIKVNEQRITSKY